MQDPVREMERHLATYPHKGVRENENKADPKPRTHQRESRPEMLPRSGGFTDKAREENTEDKDYQEEQEAARRRSRAANEEPVGVFFVDKAPDARSSLWTHLR